MTATEVKQTLDCFTNGDGVECIATTENTFIEIDVFLAVFGDCELTYTSLSSKATELENGWLERFNEWKAKGLIK